MPSPISDRVLTQAEIEAETVRFLHELEEATYAYARQAQIRSEKDVALKRAEAHAMLRASGETAADRKAQATVATIREYAEACAAEAVLDAIRMKCSNLRATLESLRTLAANVRAQT